MAEIIVEILRYGKTKKPNNPDGFKMNDIVDHLKNIGFKMDNEDFHTLNIILSKCFIVNVPKEGRYLMNAEGYFTLLEYEELEDARESSKQANKWAIIALTVSIISTLISIGFSIKQINTPTEIKREQVEQILKVFHEQTNKIDSLINVQSR